MRLLSLHIENFGGLSDHTETFEAGWNARLRPNGWGKSTLAVFIKAMLYGLPASTKRSLVENERKRYTPWQGGAYGGSLDIEVEGEAFRVERLFGAKEAEDTLTVTALATGRPADTPWAAAPGERLFGVDAAAYERSTYLAQRPEDAAGDGSVSIQTKLNRLVDATDDLGSYDRAMELLDRRRRSLRHLIGGGGEIAEGEARVAALSREITRMETGRQALADTLVRADQAKAKVAQYQTQVNELREAENSALRYREYTAVQGRLSALGAERDGAKAALDELRLALGEDIPTEQQLEALELAIRDRERAAQACQLARPNGDAGAELAALEECFVAPLLQGGAREALRQAASAYHRAAVLSGEESLPEDLTAWREATQAELAALERAAAEPNEPAKKWSRGWTALCGLGAAGGLGLLIGGVWLWPLAIAGILLLALCGGALLLVRSALRREARERAAQAEHKRAQAEEALARLRAKLTAAEAGLAFGALWCTYVNTDRLPVPAAGGAAGETERLITLADRALALGQSMARTARDCEAAQGALREAEARITAALGGREGLPADAYSALQQLRVQTQRLAESRALYGRRCREYEALQTEYQALLSAPPTAPAEGGPGAEELTARRRNAEEALTLWSETVRRETHEAQRLRGDTDELDALEQEREALVARMEEQNRALEAITSAQKYLKTARERLSGRYLDTMQDSFGRYMALLTETETPAFTMDGQLQVKLRAAGVGRPAEAFNAGMRTLIGFCQRLSLVEAMFEGEKPFLILDDPFTDLDDDTVRRAGEVLRALAERYQVLYLSCHSSRQFDDIAKEGGPQ